MPTTHTQLVDIRAADRAGGSANQDRHYILDRCVIVLDGASSPDPSSPDGGWYADSLGNELRQRLAERPDADLTQTLFDAIATVASLAALIPGTAPSSTVAIFRWSNTTAEAFVLGDSPIIVNTVDGIESVRDDRLADIAGAERHAYQDALRRGHGYGPDHRQHLRKLVDEQRAHRNRPNGYWIAEATPEAAEHARHEQWDMRRLGAALIVTDGVSRGVDQLGTPASWPQAFELANNHGPESLIDRIHDAEATDPDGERWPRSKRHDDKTVVLVTAIADIRQAQGEAAP